MLKLTPVSASGRLSIMMNFLTKRPSGAAMPNRFTRRHALDGRLGQA